MNSKDLSSTDGQNASFKGKLAALSIRFVGLLPFGVAQGIGFLFGGLAVTLNLRVVKVARRNLQICFPELTEPEREALLKKVFHHSGMLFFEIAKLWTSTTPDQALQLIKRTEGQELIEEIRDSGKGLLLILPHLGNWELVNAYLTQYFEITAMYSPAKITEVDEIMFEGRSKTGLLLAEASPRGVLKLIKHLRGGGSLAILPDQEPPSESGSFAPFFGTQALTMTLISNILRKSGAIPVLAYMKRIDKREGFELIFLPVPDEIFSENIDESLRALNAAVEIAVKEVPEQYMWGYKRFRTRPEGEYSLYKSLE